MAPTRRPAPPKAPATAVIDGVLWALGFGFTGVLVYASFGPAPTDLASFLGSDKALHAVAYAVTVFTFLLAAVWRPGRGDGPAPRATWWIAGTAVVLGAIVELVQGSVFDRDREFADALANMIGVLAAVATWRLIRRAAT